jgi:hypothetical protein
MDMADLPLSVVMVLLVISFVLVLIGAALMLGRLLSGLFGAGRPSEPPMDNIEALASQTSHDGRR